MRKLHNDVGRLNFATFVHELSHYVQFYGIAFGPSVLPQLLARYLIFGISGDSRCEYLLAITADESLGLDWMPTDSKVLACILSPVDTVAPINCLRALFNDCWIAMSAFFGVAKSRARSIGKNATKWPD
jgi:hypothetical protein